MSVEHATPHEPTDVDNETHGIGDHGEDHGHDDHGHATETLGPIDTRAWGAFVLGIGLGLVVALSIVISIGGIPA